MNRWPRELLAKADEIGLRTLGLPEEHGGIPLDTMLHGGAGVMVEAGIEKHLRDSTIFGHTEGTADMQRFKIIKAMFPDSAGVYARPDPVFMADGTVQPGTIGRKDER